MVEPTRWRRFPGYVLAAPILVTAAEPAATTAAARPPSADTTKLLGLNEIATAAALSTSGLISIEVSQDGTVLVALPRTRVGQGHTTPAATLIAAELAVPRGRIRLTVVDASPGPMLNQVDAGSHATVSTYVPVRVAAALARRRLLEAASATFGTPVVDLRLKAGVITDGAGRSLDIGALATKAASTRTVAAAVELAAPDAQPWPGPAPWGGPDSAAQRRHPQSARELLRVADGVQTTDQPLHDPHRHDAVDLPVQAQ